VLQRVDYVLIDEHPPATDSDAGDAAGARPAVERDGRGRTSQRGRHLLGRPELVLVRLCTFEWSLVL
jgi:hypothetical protein